MKKIISMLLAVVMIVACMATVAFATEPETVTVTFEVKNNPGFAALGAYLDYDKDALTLVEMESGFLGGTMLTNAKTGTYKGQWVNDKLNGQGTYTDDFSSYEGEFKDGEYSGQGTLITKRKGEVTCTYTGHFLYGKKSGKGTEKCKAGQVP